MNVCHTLICFFFLMLQDGNIGLINAQISIYKGTEGESITVQCHFKTTSWWRYFCKDECKQYILTTYGDSVQSGRYSMRYYETSIYTSGGSRLDVTITQLRQSDSGRYRCGLSTYAWGPHKQFGITVRDAPPPSKPKPTVRPAPPPPQTPPTTPKQSFTRSSTSSSSSTETTEQSEQEQTETTTDGGSGVPLYVGLTLFIFVLLFSVAVLILYKKRVSKPKEHPEEQVYVNVTETSREETRAVDGQSRSAPVENSADYSAVTAAASRPLRKPEDDSIELLYTQVDFSNRAASSLSSAPSGQADNVIYSAPQRRTDAKVDSQPLYATVTSRKKL